MTVDQVLKHFDGVANVARELGISYQAVREWVQKNEVPEGRQWQIQALTDGTLKVTKNSAA